MSTYIRGVENSFELYGLSWSKILHVANSYGWQPMGTEAPPLYDSKGKLMERHPDDPWEGTYFSNDYQRVRTEDALNLTAALERAMKDPNPEFMNEEDKAPFTPWKPRLYENMRKLIEASRERKGFLIG